MNMSSVPHTLAYEVKKLEGRLKELDQELIDHKSDQDGILNFEWVKTKRKISEIQEEIQYLSDLMDPYNPDPTTIA